MALDFQSIISAAQASGYASAGLTSEAGLLELGLLQIIANTVAPSVPTDFQSLYSAANVSSYMSAGLCSLEQGLRLSLLQIIANNVGSGGGGGAGFSAGSVNPTNGVTTGSVYANTAAGTQWYSTNNGATWYEVF
jgi:hypothetical protein